MQGSQDPFTADCKQIDDLRFDGPCGPAGPAGRIPSRPEPARRALRRCAGNSNCSLKDSRQKDLGRVLLVELHSATR
jgi:hypothetical protein